MDRYRWRETVLRMMKYTKIVYFPSNFLDGESMNRLWGQEQSFKVQRKIVGSRDSVLLFCSQLANVRNLGQDSFQPDSAIYTVKWGTSE